jgi:hypothetical protein
MDYLCLQGKMINMGGINEVTVNVKRETQHAGLRCLQPWDGMCTSQRHLTYLLLTLKPSLDLIPYHCHNYYDRTSLTIIAAGVQ